MNRPDDLEAIARSLANALLQEASTPLALPLTPAQLATVTFVADGPAPESLLRETLENPVMLQRLTRIWSESPPAPDLRARLLDNPYGKRLLDGALMPPTGAEETQPSAMSRNRESFAGSWSVEVPESWAHAAASAGSLPEVFTRSWPDLPGVTLIGRGSSTEFALIVLVDPLNARPRDLVRLQLIADDSETDVDLMVPLGHGVAEEGLVGIVWCPKPQQVTLSGPRHGMPDDPVAIALIPDSVRAADGNTRDTWRDIARDLPEKSRAREAIIEGLLS